MHRHVWTVPVDQEFSWPLAAASSPQQVHFHGVWRKAVSQPLRCGGDVRAHGERRSARVPLHEGIMNCGMLSNVQRHEAAGKAVLIVAHEHDALPHLPGQESDDRRDIEIAACCGHAAMKVEVRRDAVFDPVFGGPHPVQRFGDLGAARRQHLGRGGRPP